MSHMPRVIAAGAACAVAAVVLVTIARREARPEPVKVADARTVAAAVPMRIDAAPPPSVSARSAIVLDWGSGAVLMEKSAHQAMAPASLVKVMTALVTLLRSDPKRTVIANFTRDELDPDGTSMGLDPGEELTIEDLLYGLMLPSGNDAALVLARVVGGDEATFVRWMNQTAQALGLRQTAFANPHGLDAPGQRTTAFEMAHLARVAMYDERFRRIVATQSWTVRSQWTYEVKNRNPLLGAYPGADGVKIGWTEEAGATIVASATRNGHRVLVVLLDTEDRLADATALLDWAFTHFRWPGNPVTRSAGGRPPLRYTEIDNHSVGFP